MAERERDMNELVSDGTCVLCGGRDDRPGLYPCESSCHPAPTLAQRIVAGIERDLRDRRCVDLTGYHADYRAEIRDRWAAIVEEELARQDWTVAILEAELSRPA